MVQNVAEHFELIIQTARQVLTQAQIVQQDVTANRALLEIHGKHGNFDIRIKEILTRAERLYSFYVLLHGEVVAGYDNYPDSAVRKIKFGRSAKKHLDELIPHRHGPNKRTVELTDELNAIDFLKSLSNLK